MLCKTAIPIIETLIASNFSAFTERTTIMIEKVATRLDLKNSSSVKADLDYWLSKTPEERISAVELLRRQQHGSAARLQRTARVIQRSQR